MIRTQGLRFAYPGQPALAFADVDVPQGGVLVLRGPSGSGKSTWLALVAALVRPLVGSLVVADTDLTALSGARADAWRARSVGFLPQRLHLSPGLSVADNLGLAFWAAGVPLHATRIAAVLGALGVAELASRRPDQLSGGQAQRVALARAVLLRPPVLLADEPTASLDDAAARASLQLLLGTAADQGASLVIATHDRRVEEFLRTVEARVWQQLDLVPALADAA